MVNFLMKNRKSFMFLFGNLFLTCLSLISFGQLNIINVYKFISLDWLISLILILPFVWFFFFIKKDKEYWKKKTEPYFKYAFLAGLLLTTISSFNFDFINNVFVLKILIIFISKYLNIITILAISSGFFTLYFNKEKIEKKQIRKNQSKFLYLLGALCIIIVGLLLRLNGISSLPAWSDESTTIIVATRISMGYGHTLLSGHLYNTAFLYHSYLGLIYSFSDNHLLISRLANIPFFLINIITIYFIAKLLYEKRTALLSCLFFATSWISISMFREARFYEFFLSFFLLAVYLLIKLVLTNFKEIEFLLFTKFNIKSYLNIIKKNILNITLFFLVFLVAYDSNKQVVLMIYCFFIFGLLLFIIKKKRIGLIFSVFCYLIIFYGMLITFKYFDYRSLIYLPPTPTWKIFLTSDIYSFWNYLLKNDYYFLIYIIPLFILKTFIKKNVKDILVLSFFATLLIMISVQGYGISAIRYYYLLIPFLCLLIADCIVYLSLIISNNTKICFYTFIIFFVAISIFSGVTESYSIYNNASKNDSKNDGRDWIETIAKLNVETIIDPYLSSSYYINTNNKPDFIINDKTNPETIDGKDIYLNVPMSPNYSDGKPKIIVFRFYSYMDDSLIRLIHEKGFQIYNNRVKIYYLAN